MDERQYNYWRSFAAEEFTIAGVHPVTPNPNRRWWQFWKPKTIADRTRLQTFKVVA